MSTTTKKKVAKKSQPTLLHVLEFVQSRETKGTRVYSECDSKGNEKEYSDVVVGSLYVKKRHDSPERLIVKIFMP